MTNEETKTLTELQIVQFVQHHAYPVEKGNILEKGRCCVDGRDPNKDPISIPGADAGIVAILLAARTKLEIDITRKELVEEFLALIGGIENFHVHDIDTDPIHCGHIKNILEHHREYGLDKEDKEWFEEFLRTANAKTHKQKRLEGEHAEKAILVVKANNWSVKHKNTKGDQIFVFHEALSDRFLNNTVQRIAGDHSEINGKELGKTMKTILNRHLETTLSYLPSAQGLPTYQVNEDYLGRLQNPRSIK